MQPEYLEKMGMFKNLEKIGKNLEKIGKILKKLENKICKGPWNSKLVKALVTCIIKTRNKLVSS